MQPLSLIDVVAIRADALMEIAGRGGVEGLGGGNKAGGQNGGVASTWEGKKCVGGITMT